MSVGAVPAGRLERKPGLPSATLVTVTASATASLAASAGSGMVSSPPGPTGPATGRPARVSARRRAATGTNRPARLVSAAVNAPVMSTTTSPPLLVKSAMAPSLPTGTIVALATTRSARVLRVDASGRTVPDA